MKFAVFVVIAGLCLVAVNANGGAFAQSQPGDDESVSLEDINDVVDIEAFVIIKVLKIALRSVKGINCSIKGVVNMKLAALRFIADVNSCGGVVSKQVQNVINACNAVVTTSNNIINLNENVCNTDNADGNSKLSNSCTVKFFRQIMSLSRQISKTVNLVKKIPSAGTGASVCVTNAANNLSLTFTQFPTNVLTCSKLTSN